MLKSRAARRAALALLLAALGLSACDSGGGKADNKADNRTGGNATAAVQPDKEQGGAPLAGGNDPANEARDQQNGQGGAANGLEGEVRGAHELALKTINLSQGEGGFELWRLKAEWANLYRREGLIHVEQPRLVYFMREDDKEMHVRSERGDIEQESRTIRFIDQVLVTQDEKRISGGLLVYNGTTDTMTFPGGGDFSDQGVDGSAARITWHISEQRIEAQGDVTVFFHSQDQTAPDTGAFSGNNATPDSVAPPETDAFADDSAAPAAPNNGANKERP